MQLPVHTLESTRELLFAANLRIVTALGECHDRAPSWLDEERVGQLRCEATQARVARFPILLAQVGFDDDAAWESILNADPLGSSALMFGRQCLPLTRQLLTLAWHVVHCGDHSGVALLGLSDAVARRFSRLSLGELDDCAQHCASLLRLRWDSHDEFWIALLSAAHSADLERLEVLQLQGLQRLARVPHGL